MTRLTRLFTVYSLLATIALAVMALRVKAANRHTRIAISMAAAATARNHKPAVDWETDVFPVWDIWETP